MGTQEETAVSLIYIIIVLVFQRSADAAVLVLEVKSRHSPHLNIETVCLDECLILSGYYLFPPATEAAVPPCGSYGR